MQPVLQYATKCNTVFQYSSDVVLMSCILMISLVQYGSHGHDLLCLTLGRGSGSFFYGFLLIEDLFQVKTWRRNNLSSFWFNVTMIS